MPSLLQIPEIAAFFLGLITGLTIGIFITYVIMWRPS
jgi:hypothetical protein